VQGNQRRQSLTLVRERAVLKGLLTITAMTLVILAIARPRWGFDWVDVRHKGVDLVLVVDVSQSMMAADVSPNRLARAKRAVADFLELLRGDRVGLVAFAGASYVQCPLTEDYGAIRMFMNYLDPSLIPVQGTDLGSAVQTGLKALADGGEGDKDAKAVVIMTDGEDLQDSVEKAVAEAKAQGVRLYAVGIGTPEGGPIPEPGGGFKKDASGQVVITKPDEESLAKMALETGGMYVRSVPGGEDLKQIYEQGITANMKRREFESSRERLWHERFQWFIAAALLLIIGEWFIPDTLAAAAGALLVLTMGGSFGANKAIASDPKSAHEAFAAGQYGRAAKEFLDAEIDAPEEPGHAYNRAVSQYKDGKFAEAAEGFTKAAAKSQDQRLVERAMFNLGNARVGEGKLDDAIAAYEAALQIDPQDQAARENLEYVKNLKDQKQNQNQNQNQDKNNDQNKDQNQNQDKNNDQNKDQNKNQDKNNDQNKDQNKNQDKNNDQNKDQNKNQDKNNDQNKDQSKDQNKDQNQNQDKNNDRNKDQSKDAQDKNQDKNEDQKKNQDQSNGSQDKEQDKKPPEQDRGKGQPRQVKAKPSDEEAERLLRAVDDQAGKYLYAPQGSGEPPRPAKDW
jgi:Ca-activated chloride channel homolog